jgi:hypothetical protein
VIKLGTIRAPAFRALLSPPFPWRQTSMRMHPSLARRRFLLLRRIPFAVPAEGPGPTGRDHQCLQVIFPREALRHGAVVACIVAYLLACHRPASDEVFQSLLGQRPWLPLPIVAGLALFGRIDAEQPRQTLRCHRRQFGSAASQLVGKWCRYLFPHEPQKPVRRQEERNEESEQLDPLAGGPPLAVSAWRSARAQTSHRRLLLQCQPREE